MVQLIAVLLILTTSVYGKHVPKDLQLVLDKLYEDGYGVEYTPNGTANAVLTEHLGKADFVSDILGYVSKILSNTVASGDAQDANLFLTKALAQKGNPQPIIDSQVKYAAVKTPLPQRTLLMSNSVSRYHPPEIHGRRAELTQSVVNKSVIKQVIDQHNTDDNMKPMLTNLSPAPTNQLGNIFNQNSLPTGNTIASDQNSGIKDINLNNVASMISNAQNGFVRKQPENNFKSFDTTPSSLSGNKPKEETLLNKAALFDLFSKFMLEDSPLTSPELRLMISNISKMIQTTPSAFNALKVSTGTQQPLAFGKPVHKLGPEGAGLKKNDEKSKLQADFKRKALEAFLANAKAKGFDFTSSLLGSPKSDDNSHLYKLGPNAPPFDIKQIKGYEYRPKDIPLSQIAAKSKTVDWQNSARHHEAKSWWRPQFTSKDSEGLAIFQKAMKNAHWNQGSEEKDPLSKLYQKLISDENKRTGDVHHGPDR